MKRPIGRESIVHWIYVTYLIGVGQLELPAVARPAYAGLAAAVGQELQEELPELNGATACVENGCLLPSPLQPS